MTKITMREVQGDEAYDIVHWLNAYAFRPSPPLSDRGEWGERARQRRMTAYYALFADGAPLACAARTPLFQSVRGATFDMGGMLNVATHPGARRKGYARQILTFVLDAIRLAGQPLSCLYPSSESFYERLGYVAFPRSRKVTFKPQVLQPLLKADLGGEVELLSIGDGYDAYRDYLRVIQPQIHGMAIFVEPQKASAQRNPTWMALAKVAGEPVGVMLYDLKGEQPGTFNLRAHRFYYHTSQGKYLLLAWIARHIDQATQAELWLPAYEHPETWLEGLHAATEYGALAPTGRVVHVARIGGMRTGPGRFTARLNDPLCPWNEGTWAFESREGILRVGPAVKSGCDLGIQALAALVYGTQDPGDFAIRGWGNPSPQIQATMRTMFPPRVPHLHEYF